MTASSPRVPAAPSSAPIVLHFVRHGQSTWNVEGRIQGQTSHVPLTAKGRLQAEGAATLLCNRGAHSLFTSDLVRAEQTATTVAVALGLTAIHEPALREQALGSLEGRLAADLDVATTSPGRRVSSVRWGGGESVEDVYHRVGAFLSRTLSGAQPGGIVLVTHGDTIRIALAWLRGLGPHEVDWFGVPNGSVSSVECSSGSPAVGTEPRRHRTLATPGGR